jgi:type II secretory pathway pseudopilin PulG
MCDPATAMLAISVLSAGVSYVQGQQQAEDSAEAANEATELSYQQNAERQSQVNDQSALDKAERTKQGMLERAKMATISGESGALGLSSDRLIADSFMQEGTDISSLEKNRLNNQTQTSWDNRQAEATGKSRINDAEAKAPSLIQTGLQIGSDYVDYKSKTKPKV